MSTPFPAYKGEGTYQFVCYAHEDAKAVFAELQPLQELGFRIWYDEGISLGHEWTDDLARAISGASEVLYFVSPRSVSSRNCRNELQFAASRQKKIVAIHLEPTELPGGVELAIGLSQAIYRYDVNDETFIRKLTTDLTRPDASLPEPVLRKRGGLIPKTTATLITVSLIVLLSLAWWSMESHQPGSDQPSVAVMPFENLSSDPEQVFFSEGVAEEVLNLLAKSTEIRVISRSSSFSFAHRGLTLPEVAKQLGVNHILQGSVRKSGDTVRVAVQLVEVRSDSYLWSVSYDRKLDEIFAIQDEIAREVAAALNVVLAGGSTRQAPANPEAYALYLRARYALGTGATNEDLKAIEQQLKRAIELDPGYVAAWRELGRVYLQQSNSGIITREQGLSLRWETISRALEIDPDDAVSNAYRAFQEAFIKGDLQEGARRFERALELAPTHEDVLRPLILFLLYLNRVTESLPFAELAVDRDPLCGFCLLNLGEINRMLGRLDRAENNLVTATTVLKDSSHATSLRAQIELLKGNPEQALALYIQMPEADAERLAGTAIAYHRLGREAEFNETLEHLKSHGPDTFPQIATVYAAIGDPDNAFSWLQRGIEANPDRPRPVTGMPRPAAWMRYWDDARWQNYLDRLHRSPARLSAVDFHPAPPTAMPSTRNSWIQQ
ncbi:MAG: TIR domain-containing protein [Pseudomonadales bacterium]